jgi:hypothetical protein
MAGETHLDSISDFPSLLTYLEEELDWPIDAASFDEATFGYSPAELGLRDEAVGGNIEIKQLRPLVDNQPWGVFFLNLPHKRLSKTIVSNILGRLTVKKRAASSDPGRPAFAKSDLLFIASTGSDRDRRLAFAHFRDDPAGGNAATLELLGWDEDDTPRRLKLTASTLAEKLRWPEDTTNATDWRKQWSAAFGHADTFTNVRDVKAMAVALAALARRIRSRASELIAAQTAEGSMVKLHAAFKEALIHDLTVDGFADTYAQTIAYGLLSTAISRNSGALTQDDLPLNVAATSPFLKEMLATFIEAGGRRGGQDGEGLNFDELGVSEVVRLLQEADMTAVLADFDRRNPDEDPVIHFYELFLKQYDPVQKVKRGVFYTPRPVVGFIVRSVDEVLRNEFGLADGLASTTTWAEMIASKPAIKLPDGAKPSDPFVRILDPATGTGTFLVECVDLIHNTMVGKWKVEGKREDEIRRRWNDYVPKHLLPRLNGFELMMAPYAIAHVKLGLKLWDTGYRFGSDARAQIYLTNALEPAHNLNMQLAFMSEALAHEARAANLAKAAAFTVLIGNPPYSGISSNMQPWAQALVDRFRYIKGKALGERKSWLQNDYVKFFALALRSLENSGAGVIGYITDNSYLDGPTFRGLRYQVATEFSCAQVLDLGGKSTVASTGAKDENVFDIQQGVAILVLDLSPGNRPLVRVGRLRGPVADKFKVLSNLGIAQVANTQGHPRDEFYDFFDRPISSIEVEYSQFPQLNSLFESNSVGVQTSRDHLAVAFTLPELASVIDRLVDASVPDEVLRSEWFSNASPNSKYLPGDTRGWQLSQVRVKLRKSQDQASALVPIAYRPMDKRYFAATELLSDWPRPELASAMRLDGNLCLNVVRRTENDREYDYVLVSDTIPSNHFVSLKDGSYGFPLWSAPQLDGNARLNIAPAFMDRLEELTATSLALQGDRSTGVDRGAFRARQAFDWIYAILHSPKYRMRYSSYLKIDFARIPLPRDGRFFQALVPFGTELVALHLLDPDVSPILVDPKSVRFAGAGDGRVTRTAADFESDAWESGRMYVSDSQWFETVPERVANFHIGGFRPARKWLKDRAARGGKSRSSGRLLTGEDILHYRRMVVAMDRTIDIMVEIDRVIEANGGWPEAFRGMPSSG